MLQFFSRKKRVFFRILFAIIFLRFFSIYSKGRQTSKIIKTHADWNSDPLIATWKGLYLLKGSSWLRGGQNSPPQNRHLSILWEGQASTSMWSAVFGKHQKLWFWSFLAGEQKTWFLGSHSKKLFLAEMKINCCRQFRFAQIPEIYTGF